MTGCEEFAETLNAVLDGDAPASAVACDHVRACRDCRELAAAATLLAVAGLALRAAPAVPAELTARLVRVRRLPRVVPAALAASLVVGAMWLLRPVGPAVPDVARPNLSGTAGPTPRFDDQLATVATVARSASERAVAPTRLFNPPAPSPPAPPHPQADVLATLGTASKTAAGPVAGTARRAVGLFLRDLRLTAKPAG